MFWHHFSHTSVSIFVVLLLLITDICSAQPLMQGVTDLSPAGPVELTTNLNQPPSPIRLKTNMDHFPTNTLPWYLNGQWKALHTVKHLKPSMLIMTLWLNCPITVWIKAYSTLYYSILNGATVDTAVYYCFIVAENGRHRKDDDCCNWTLHHSSETQTTLIMFTSEITADKQLLLWK